MAQKTVLTGLLLLALLALAASASPVLPVGEPTAVSTQTAAMTMDSARAQSATSASVLPAPSLSLDAFALDFAVTLSPSPIEPAMPLSPPALPSALVLVLIGFALLTAVRDRRAWYNAALGLFRLTQAGLAVLPRMAAAFAAGRACGTAVTGRITDKRQETACRMVTPEISFVGLLHRLGSAGGDDKIATGLRWITWTFQNAARLCYSKPAAFSFAFATLTTGFAGGNAHLMEIGNTRKLEIFYPRERR